MLTLLWELCERSPALDTMFVSPDTVVREVLKALPGTKITADDLDFVAETIAYMGTQHPDYLKLAGRVLVYALHMRTDPCIRTTVLEIHDRAPGVLSNKYWTFVDKHYHALNRMLDYSRDYQYDYFALKTLYRGYLLRGKDTKELLERPQHALLRSALVACGFDMERLPRYYGRLSRQEYTHATPTLFNACTQNQQLSSCFLMPVNGDSIEGIYKTLTDCAVISKNSGGIGISLHNVRATGTYIQGTNGYSNGLVPMLRVFNETARYVDQGGGKRKGAFAVYLEPWHADIFEWLQLKRNHGAEDKRARDLFYGLWIPDLFMQRVKEQGKWSLFCPRKAPGLADVWGEAFNALYTKYEATEGLAHRVVNAVDLLREIVTSQIETGTPYMLYKDSCNRKSNQQNLGTIQCSNLCTEVIEYTSPEETAVCNLASISLPSCLGDHGFSFAKLGEITRDVVYALDNIIDLNVYPTPETVKSNHRNRPIGIGVQGLADVFNRLHLPFTSCAARALNKKIFEVIYYNALLASVELASVHGAYASFKGSPAYHGKLQPDLWELEVPDDPVNGLEWSELKRLVMAIGLRNSLLVAPMPTASTSQIMGNNECFEPFTSNIYTRQVLSGNYTMVNKHLVQDLVSHGLWNTRMRERIIRNRGSVQGIKQVPAKLQAIYRTVWEIKQRDLIDMAADRAPFIDQSMSMNIFLAAPTPAKLYAMHLYTWGKGLKTGMYYLRTRPASNALQFTVTPDHQRRNTQTEEVKVEAEEECTLCCGS